MPWNDTSNLMYIFRGWDDNIKMDIAQDMDRWWALVLAVMNLWGSIKCGEFLD